LQSGAATLRPKLKSGTAGADKLRVGHPLPSLL
jgi:hypothetical protein